MKRLRLAIGTLAVFLTAGCASVGPVWDKIPQEDRTTILRTTIQAGVQALVGRVLPESACTMQMPDLWPRATFAGTFRPNAIAGLKASGFNPPSGVGPDGPGALRMGPNGCVEIHVMAPGDPGNAWVPYTGSAEQFVQANYLHRYGPQYWAGHGPFVQDSDVCAARAWYQELQGKTFGCSAMEVIDTWWDKATFDSLRAEYRRLHPDTDPGATPAPAPPTPPAPTLPAPQLPPAPAAKCDSCCPPAPSCPLCPALTIPAEILATLQEAPGKVTIRGGRLKKADLAWKARLQAVKEWAEGAKP